MLCIENHTIFNRDHTFPSQSQQQVASATLAACIRSVRRVLRTGGLYLVLSVRSPPAVLPFLDCPGCDVAVKTLRPYPDGGLLDHPQNCLFAYHMRKVKGDEGAVPG